MARAQRAQTTEEPKTVEEQVIEESAPVEEPVEQLQDTPAETPWDLAVKEAAPIEDAPQFVAEEYFTDSLTGRQFKKGDVVEGWDLDRFEAYTRRGLLSKVGPSLTAETGPSEVA